MTKQEIDAIASKVTSGLGAAGVNPAVVYGTAGPSARSASVPDSPRGWLFDTVDEAVARAQAAQRVLAAMTLEERGRLIEAMRGAGRDNARKLAQMAHDETGYGQVEHKVLKNLLAANKTPGIEDLATQAWSGDYGLTLVEMAPFGVIASITPSTNPPSTVINNSISMIAAGNAVVFNPHPAAKKVSREAMRVLNEAIAGAGGPEGLITTVREPTLESGAAIMAHPAIPLLSITGGEAVVRAAMKTGKKVIAAGPGNPPVIVDDTALLEKAAKDIVDGASFDNNVLCVAEKEVFAFDSVTDALIAEMVKNGAFLVTGGDIDKVLAVTLIHKDGKYVINRKYVGRSPSVILRDAGVAFSGEPSLVIAEVDPFHPFIMTEMLMPVLGIARVRDIDDAVAHAVRAEQGCQHSALIHSTNVRNMSRAAHALNTTIFVKNAPSYAGLGFNGEGYATLTIATPTGEGLTAAHSFTRARRCVLYGDFRIV
ncbi:MAG: aldehyde dehydrogenase EutE [Treponema sp.]|jgi:propionaldehyde dehydrogenase|nr:aldehyde dehydrogenase EutE [Treponema sp.]